MARVFPNICYYISEKELKREKIGYFLSWSLRGCSEPATSGRGIAWILESGPYLSNLRRGGRHALFSVVLKLKRLLLHAYDES